ncbi:hypothetical protein [Sphingomonas montana]|uniref:hypothetical protein n=1 Tax=Sphingomonas montana TaxID=1843236 RepID=UPI00101AE927|nr:hypothetical protein [Sphingomonas montana]
MAAGPARTALRPFKVGDPASVDDPDRSPPQRTSIKPLRWTVPRAGWNWTVSCAPSPVRRFADILSLMIGRAVSPHDTSLE